MDHIKIYDKIKEGKATMIGKIGANELNYLFVLLSQMGNNRIKEMYTFNVCAQAGLYPVDENILKKFMFEEYLTSLSEFDVVAMWNQNKAFEEFIVNLKAPNSIRVSLESLEPYYYDLNWTKLLENKKVLIISPFTESIKKQYAIRDKIWKNNLLSSFEPIYLQFPLSFYLVSDEERRNYPSNCIELLQVYKHKISDLNFDIALIGVGVYSLPIAAYVKRKGKIGYHLGGPLQILFGICGGRWDKYPFYNEHWIRPSSNEIPLHKELCENGCYW